MVKSRFALARFTGERPQHRRVFLGLHGFGERHFSLLVNQMGDLIVRWQIGGTTHAPVLKDQAVMGRKGFVLLDCVFLTIQGINDKYR